MFENRAEARIDLSRLSENIELLKKKSKNNHNSSIELVQDTNEKLLHEILGQRKVKLFLFRQFKIR